MACELGSKKGSLESLSERIDALEVSFLLLLNSLRNVKQIDTSEEKSVLIQQIPESTLEIIESILSTK